MRPTFSIYLLICLGIQSQVSASDPLPEGLGLSGGFPGDRGIANHAAVLLVEDFENAALTDLKGGWNEVENKDGKVLELVSGKPEASAGKQCLQVTATLGENTGGHLFKRIDPIQERVFARFYVKLETFEGFRWRTVPELAVSYFMLSHYVTENAYRQNKVEQPPKLNRVWFDDIVIATEYIGPIAKP